MWNKQGFPKITTLTSVQTKPIICSSGRRWQHPGHAVPQATATWPIALFSLHTIQTSLEHNIYDYTYMSYICYFIAFTKVLNNTDLLVNLVEY